MLLCDDITFSICEFLDNKNKIQFLSVNTTMDAYKDKVFYNDIADFYNIINLFYFDQFVNIYTDVLYTFPKHIKYLTFDSDFDEDVENDLPYGITHLCFLNYFKHSRCTSIPSSVTHLVINKGFCYNNIHGITYASNKIILPSVNHLEFGCQFKQDLPSIPSSVKTITLSTYYDKIIPDNLNVKWI